MLNNRLIFIVLTLFIISCNKLEVTPNYEKFSSDIGELNYRILYPKNFDKTKTYPITLFLHGIGERGDDNELQLKYIDRVFLNSQNYNDFPSVVIFPQAPLSDNWSSRILIDNEIRQFFPKNSTPTNSLRLVIQLMDSLSKEKHINNKRIYLTGLSNGAMGSFELLKHRPNMFASAVLICGGGDLDWAKKFAKTTPVWIAHGAKDRIVYPELSLKMAEAIIREGGNPKLTLYENVFHDSWYNVFEDPMYLEWLFSHTKN
jgi:predicted peptidase